MLLSLHQKGHTTWVAHVNNILFYNGFRDVWYFGCGNEKGFCKELKLRLFSNFCHNWQNHLDTSPRLAQYRKIKQSFEREFYLEVLFVDVYRNVFAQFRMGVSQLNVHRYRFSPSPENTNCPLCPN